MRPDRRERFQAALRAFPSSAQPILQRLPHRGGMLSRTSCRELMHKLDLSMEMLMMRLLPLARVFAVASISEFQVGAVAMAGKGPFEGEMNLFLGANMEFKPLALGMTLHAEQAAVMNAWHGGADCFKAIAVSESPCGYCRQFLSEVCDPAELDILGPAEGEDAYAPNRLSKVLPNAMTPSNLGYDSCLMTTAPAARKLKLFPQSDDPVVQAARSAAEASYAPYTGNFAGCAFYVADHGIVSGRYMESVAFNPSISPFHSAILQLNQRALEEKQIIERVVLVEKPANIRQKDLVEMLIRACAPEITLEYHIATEEE